MLNGRTHERLNLGTVTRTDDRDGRITATKKDVASVGLEQFRRGVDRWRRKALTQRDKNLLGISGDGRIHGKPHDDLGRC